MRWVRLCIALVGLLVLTGCVTSNVEQLQKAPVPGGIAADESVVVLARRHHGTRFTEGEFAQCVADSLADLGIAVYPRMRFRNRLFPWFEPRAAPVSTEYLPDLLANPLIAKQLRATSVRYLVWLDGRTRDGNSGGSMSCGVTPAAAACLGFAWWKEHAQYDAYIWDLQATRSVGRLSVDASGTSYMPAVIIPLPLIARTEAAACDDIADQIAEMLQPASQG